MTVLSSRVLEGRKEMFYSMMDGCMEVFYLMTHSTHFIYGYMALYGYMDIMVKNHSDSERGNPLLHMGYSFRLAARGVLYAPSHRQDRNKKGGREEGRE